MRFSILLLLLLTNVGLFANPLNKSKNDTIRNTFNKDFIYQLKKATSSIKIDGVIEESDWMVAQKANNFYRVLPVDTGFAYQQSEILMTYDEKAFYLAFTFNDTVEGKRIMESFRRDFTFYNNDNFLAFSIRFLTKPMVLLLGFLRQEPNGTELCMMVPEVI